jgi:hypothetical protein
MGKSERLDSEEPRALTAARGALSAAIAHVATLKAELAAAEAAASAAKRQKYDARDRLDTLRAEPERTGRGSRFIESVAAGAPLSVEALAGSKRESEASLEREIDTWQRTQSECDAVVREKKDLLGSASARLINRADDVIRAGNVVTGRHVDEVERLQTELTRRRVFLRFFERARLVQDEALAKRVRAVLNDRDLPMASDAGEFGNFDAHPVHCEWAAARAALLSDASASLPASDVRRL